jgi:hypothetical protein
MFRTGVPAGLTLRRRVVGRVRVVHPEKAEMAFFPDKGDTIVFGNLYYGPCSAGIGTKRARKLRVANGVLRAFLPKTASGGSKTRETPVFAIGLTSESGGFTSEKILLLILEKVCDL